jgi:hypothetical protein
MAANEDPEDPHLEEDKKAWYEHVNAFSAETDRAAILLAGSKLDELLCDVLQAALQPWPDSKDPLFDPERPLGTFSARIHLAHRLGLIDNAFAKALHAIRKIRNDFAHGNEKARLDEPPYRDSIRSLVALWDQPSQVKEMADALAKKSDGSLAKRSRPALEFYAACCHLLIGLQFLFRGVHPIRVPRVAFLGPSPRGSGPAEEDPGGR